MKIIEEIRIVTHLSHGVGVVLIFRDGTSSAYEDRFTSIGKAKSFVDGIKQGFAWQKKGVKLSRGA